MFSPFGADRIRYSDQMGEVSCSKKSGLISRTSIYWFLVDGGVKVVVQERYPVSSAVSESHRKMMDLVTLLSGFSAIHNRRHLLMG